MDMTILMTVGITLFVTAIVVAIYNDIKDRIKCNKQTKASELNRLIDNKLYMIQHRGEDNLRRLVSLESQINPPEKM